MYRVSLEHSVLLENKGNYKDPGVTSEGRRGLCDSSLNEPKLGINKNNNCYELKYIKYLKTPTVQMILKQVNKKTLVRHH